MRLIKAVIDVDGNDVTVVQMPDRLEIDLPHGSERAEVEMAVNGLKSMLDGSASGDVDRSVDGLRERIRAVEWTIQTSVNRLLRDYPGTVIEQISVDQSRPDQWVLGSTPRPVEAVQVRRTRVRVSVE